MNLSHVNVYRFVAAFCGFVLQQNYHTSVIYMISCKENLNIITNIYKQAK